MSLAARENVNTLVAVSAYAGDLHQVQQNLPVYLHHEAQLVILSPKDAPIERVDHPGVICMQAGLKGWIGQHTLERQRLFLELLLRFPQQYFLFNDADSFCLSPRVPKYCYDRPDILWSNEVLDTNPAPSKLPKLALQPPYFFSRKVVEAMLEGAKHPATSYFQGAEGFENLPVPTQCIDHWMLQVISATTVEHKNFFTGASFNTSLGGRVDPHGAAVMEDLVKNHGRVLIHSVKDAGVLQRLVAAHKEFVRTHS